MDDNDLKPLAKQRTALLATLATIATPSRTIGLTAFVMKGENDLTTFMTGLVAGKATETAVVTVLIILGRLFSTIVL